MVGGFQLGNSEKYVIATNPRSIMELSDVISIIRPGSKEAFLEDGKSITDHYIMRKTGKEPVQYLHPSLEPILKDTYGLGIFQEDYLKIGAEIAGLTLEEADYYIRTGIGKKKTAIIAEAKPKLINGFIKHGLSQSQANELYDWIKAGQRYSFGMCLSPDTIVENEKKEYITLSEVKIGDKIRCPKFDKQKYTKILNKFDQGKQPVYRITLDSGKQIICTISHKFLCEDGKVKTLKKIIENQDKIVCQQE